MSRPVRLLLDAGALLMVAALVVGGLTLRRSQGAQEALADQVAENVRQLEVAIKYHAAAERTTINGRGWPVTIDLAWFEQTAPPRNVLLSDAHPWVEVASPEEANLLHPPIRMAVHEALAGFWYNPYQGVVRARVPVLVRDDEALEVYNRINHCSLASIFATQQAERPPRFGVAATGPEPAQEPAVEPEPEVAEGDDATPEPVDPTPLVLTDPPPPQPVGPIQVPPK